MGDVVVDNTRLATVETDVKHLSQDVSEIKDELKSVCETNKSVGQSLAKLTLLAEQGQDRDEKILPRLEKVEAWQLKKDGVILIVVAIFSLFGENITKALGL